MTLLLAQAVDKSSELFGKVLPWLIMLLIVIVAGGVIIFIARRYVSAGEDPSGGGFTLHDLREMHRAGEISDEEFTRAKAQMIGRLAADKSVKPDESGGVSTGNPTPSEN